jgi:hypothetical protein
MIRCVGCHRLAEDLSEADMASETIKALLMITLFCGLQAALHLPQLINSQMAKRRRQTMFVHRLHWHPHIPISYALIPVRARRSGR